MHTGQDPRRFGEDLLEYMRDLIVVLAAGQEAGALLPGISAPVIEQMRSLATTLGPHRLSGMADVVSEALQSMTGATSPRLHLELLMARLLLDGSPSPTASQPVAALAPMSPPPVETPASASAPVTETPAEPAKPLSVELLTASWPAVIDSVAEKKRAVWTALLDTEALALVDDVVTIGFPSLQAAEVLKKPQGPGLPVNAELVREAILAVTGHRVRFKVQEIVRDESVVDPVQSAPSPEPTLQSEPEPASWPTVTPPGTPEPEVAEVDAEDEPPEVPTTTSSQGQIGEAVIREVLGGELVEEHPVSEQDER
jgi:DNA polymerase-3 subunit gamma/tau